MMLLIANNCWTRSFALGYWLFYFSNVFDSDEERKPLQEKDCLKWVCMLPYYPCPYWDQSIFVTVGNYIVSNHLIAGSIMVRHMIFILVLSLPLRVYYLMRCTHNALWWVIMNSFDSTTSYFGCLLFLARSARFVLLGGMWIPFQYFTDFVVSLETWVVRVLKVAVIPTDCPVL